MPRVKRGFKARRRRNKVLKLAKGFRGARSKLFRSATEAVDRALNYAFRARKVRQRDFRALHRQLRLRQRQLLATRLPISQRFTRLRQRGLGFGDVCRRRLEQKLPLSLDARFLEGSGVFGVLSVQPHQQVPAHDELVETPRAPLDLTGGSASTVDLYQTIIMGRQSLAKAHSITDGNGAYPKVVRGPVVDSLMRFNPIGWYWLGGYGIFRQAAIRVINSSSSLGGA